MSHSLHTPSRADARSNALGAMNSSTNSQDRLRFFKALRFLQRQSISVLMTVLLLPAVAFAQQSPWERAASNLAFTFTGPLARSLALVSIVIGGLMFMFGEGGAKRQISGIVFGGGLALFAAQFMTWLF